MCDRYPYHEEWVSGYDRAMERRRVREIASTVVVVATVPIAGGWLLQRVGSDLLGPLLLVLSLGLSLAVWRDVDRTLRRFDRPYERVDAAWVVAAFVLGYFGALAWAAVGKPARIRQLEAGF